MDRLGKINAFVVPTKGTLVLEHMHCQQHWEPKKIASATFPSLTADKLSRFFKDKIDAVRATTANAEPHHLTYGH
jgi:hypothetical protein